MDFWTRNYVACIICAWGKIIFINKHPRMNVSGWNSVPPGKFQRFNDFMIPRSVGNKLIDIIQLRSNFNWICACLEPTFDFNVIILMIVCLRYAEIHILVHGHAFECIVSVALLNILDSFHYFFVKSINHFFTYYGLWVILI